MPLPSRRNRSFEETHKELIATSIRLISESGAAALSLVTLAREVGINRTTIYYHFPSREALLEEVKVWSSEQLAKAFDMQGPQVDRIDYITRFVVENPELIRLWIDDFVSPGNIRDRYPSWDSIVRGMAAHFKEIGETKADPEVFCVVLLTTAFIGPHVFKQSVRPKDKNEQIVLRFRREQQRLLNQQGLLDVRALARRAKSTRKIKRS